MADRKKILVVDDEPNIVRMLESRLKGSGYDVITAMDGLDALHKARSESPDLILLDVMLPQMDGYKVCAMLKYDVKYARVPIIMLTARAHEADRKMGEQLGVEAYVVKPFEGKQLLEKIERILRN
jgi:DNA-binding response OmpR family regulator